MSEEKRRDKKRDKRNYLHDFKESAGGGYVYTGVTWHADGVLRRQMLMKLWSRAGCHALVGMSSGDYHDSSLLNTFYVIIPYVIWFISDIVLTYTLGSITLGGNPLRDYVYQRSVMQYTVRTVFPLAGAALTALAMIVFLLRGGSGEGAVLCLICCVIQIAGSVTASRIGIRDIWTC